LGEAKLARGRTFILSNPTVAPRSRIRIHGEQIKIGDPRIATSIAFYFTLG
jgi:hypothetical protein